MYLECVITCANYGDFLAETLPLNKGLFNHLVIVTTPEDVETQKLAEHWHVRCVQTEAFGADFAKGAAINVGLQALTMQGWVLHLDADMVLPPLTRRLLENANLDPTMIYGCDRHLIQSAAKWRQHLRKPRLQQEDNVYVHAEAYPIATRFVASSYGGYLPIGFFQLWNPEVSGITRYPENHTGAGRTDILFARQWLRAKRGFLPEIIAYHLESERAPQGANWDGRQTIRFDIKPSRWRCLHWVWWKRHHKHRHRHHHPYGVDHLDDRPESPWWVWTPHLTRITRADMLL